MREAMCQSILELAIAKGCIMLNAPAFSGKTSMLQLFRQTGVSAPQMGRIHGILSADRVSAGYPFLKLWERGMGISWRGAISPQCSSQAEGSAGTKGPITLGLVDNAQTLCDVTAPGVSDFWEFAQQCIAEQSKIERPSQVSESQVADERSVRIIMAADHCCSLHATEGLPAPVSFQAKCLVYMK